MMKAMMLVATDTFELQELAIPEPGPGQVLVRVEATAICNTTDMKVKQAADPTTEWPNKPHPVLLGHEVCGTVEALGTDVAGWREGDRISGWGIGGGGFAEYCLLSPDSMAAVKVPPEMPAATASLLELAVGTARYLYADEARKRLADAATAYVVGLGPSGLFYLLECLNLGVKTVYASGRHAQRLEMAREFGATEVLDAAEVDSAQVLAERGVSVDVAVDTTGRDFSADLLKVTGTGGVIVPFGVGWPWSDHLDVFSERDILVANGGVEEARRAAAPMMEWIARGTMPIERTITHRIHLADLEAGFEMIKKREAVKVVVEF